MSAIKEICCHYRKQKLATEFSYLKKTNELNLRRKRENKVKKQGGGKG